jgi:hypothetical protein
MVPIYDPSTQKAETGGLRLQYRLELHSEILSQKKKKRRVLVELLLSLYLKCSLEFIYEAAWVWSFLSGNVF